jgi:hypothetical protein
MTTQLDAFFHDDIPETAWLRDASGAGGVDTLIAEAAMAVESTQADHSPILRIRPFSIGDMRPLGKLPGMLRLDVPDSLLQRRGEMLDLTAALPFLRQERPTFVAAADSQPVGFVRFSPRGPDGRWVMTAIAASTGVYSPEPVWEALLTHGVRAAGLRGVRRLFARVPVGHPLIESMRRSGWSPYSRETVFRAERITARSRVVQGLRKQEPADTWAIHQLYAHSVPRQIQEIEALTSQVWHIDQRRRRRKGVRRSGWLLEDGGTLSGYGRLSKGSRAGMIDIVVAPGDRRRFAALLDGIAVAPSPQRTIYCALRAYLLDLRDELTDRGFVEVGEQELFIRYTTAAARAPALDPIHFPVELRPALPSQAPTFLEGQPTDGAI